MGKSKRKHDGRRERDEKQARKVVFTIGAVFCVLMLLLWAYSSVIN